MTVMQNPTRRQFLTASAAFAGTAFAPNLLLGQDKPSKQLNVAAVGCGGKGASDISERFGVSHTAALLGLSLFLWALGLGAIIAAPVSEQYGRRIVYLATVPVFGLFILGSGLAQNFATLLVCRFFAGFFGSAVVSVGGGTNADLWQPALAGFVYPFYFVSPFLGPAFGTTRLPVPPTPAVQAAPLSVLTTLRARHRWLPE